MDAMTKLAKDIPADVEVVYLGDLTRTVVVFVPPGCALTWDNPERGTHVFELVRPEDLAMAREEAALTVTKERA